MKTLSCILSLTLPLVLGGAVVPGQWGDDFDAAKAYAESNDLPLVMVWGMDGCTHCDELESALKSSAGLTWAEAQNAVFCMRRGSAKGTDEARDFTGGTMSDPPQVTATPLVRFYWKDRKSVRFSGRSGSMYSTEGSGLLAQFENSFAKFYAEAQDVSAPAFFFPMGDHECDRLEVLKASKGKTFDIPVMRTNGLDTVTSCTLSFALNVTGWNAPKPPADCTLEWGKGESLKFASPTLPKDKGTSSYSKVTVTLKDSDGTELGKRTITVLNSAPENSPKNPYWLGEKTEDTLEWGEWTMDLDIVTNKVKAWNAANPSSPAYAMMFVGGSCWCPDCAMAEANFFNDSRFKEWAAENRVVFGVLDIPNNPQSYNAYPSQLRYESYRTSDAYVSLRGTAPTNETERYQSGAGYLSRHGVKYDDALAVSARNAFLLGHTTLEGGWNTPERSEKVNANRTGVPVLLLLRDDGTVAARWNRFSDVGPSAYSDGYLRRFEEMMAQAPDTNEESDDDCRTTRRTIGPDGVASSTVSTVDQADVYRITGAHVGDQLTFTVTGGGARLKVSVVDSNRTEIAASAGLASSGIQLSMPVAVEDELFLRIAPETVADGTFFGYVNSGSTVCDYSVAFACESHGGEIGFTSKTINVFEDCGTVLLSVARANGSKGSARVKVKLSDPRIEDVQGRIRWTDTTLSWASGESGEKTATLTVVDDSEVGGDLKLTFNLGEPWFESGDGVITADSLTVNIFEDDVFGTRLYRNVAVPEDVRPVSGYRDGDEIVCVPKSGALPAGVTLVQDGGSVRVAGVPVGAAGEYSAVYTVKLLRSGGEVLSTEMTFDFTVIDYDFSGDFPSLATEKAYGNLPFVPDGRVVVGILTIAVPPDGRLSAKYLSNGQAFSYAADAWASFDARAKTLTAELVPTAEGAGSMTVTYDVLGGRVSFADPTGVSRTLEFVLPLEAWPNGAGAWKGQYTVQMPQTNEVDGISKVRMAGAAGMTLLMTNDAAIASGTMTYVAFLPNGRTIYGSSMLIDGGDGNALLPFYHFSGLRTSPFVFSGGLKIAKNASTDYRTVRWSVTGAWTPALSVGDCYGLTCDFNVFGGYYDKDEIKARFDEDFAGKTESFAFLAKTGTIFSGRYGSGTEMSPVKAEITSANVPRLVGGASNPQEVELDFSADTGVIRGSFVFPFANGETAVTFRGVVLPGWQGCASCSIGGDAVERPWAAGACAFSDRVRGDGPFRNGCTIEMGEAK